jgi:hypothetical protein
MINEAELRRMAARWGVDPNAERITLGVWGSKRILSHISSTIACTCALSGCR